MALAEATAWRVHDLASEVITASDEVIATITRLR